jgi:hypothetical protein
MADTEAQGEQFEEVLQAKSQEGNEMVMGLLRSLGGAVVYPDATNFETNKKLWNVYAKEWKPDATWVQDMVKPLGMSEDSLAFVGDEWSQIDHLEQVVAEYIHVSKPSFNSSRVS